MGKIISFPLSRNVLRARVPKPDRSDYKPNFQKADLDDHIDLAWSEGLLIDGRPFRIECWCAFGWTFLTYFLSTTGLENANNMELEDLLVFSSVLNFRPENKYGVECRKIFDASGNEMWSIDVIVGDEDGTYASNGKVSLKRYERPN